MRAWSLTFCLFFLVACQTGQAREDAKSGPGDHDFSLIHDKLKRNFVVHVPQSYKRGNPTPLIIAIHGGGGMPIHQIEMSDMNRSSERHGYIVAYPEGSGRRLGRKLFGTFNAGECCGKAEENGVDDVGFIRKMISRLKLKYSIDPSRIYATGHSNGALMSYRLACELSDQIAAIAPNAGHDAFKNCNPSRPVPILHFHGTKDSQAHYNGGGKCGGGLNPRTWNCRSVPEFLKDWRKINGCSASKAKEILNRGDTRCVSWGPCENGSDVRLCTIDGGGHTWPGGNYAKRSRFWKRKMGKVTKAISANEQMWRFFQAHPLK